MRTVINCKQCGDLLDSFDWPEEKYVEYPKPDRLYIKLEPHSCNVTSGNEHFKGNIPGVVPERVDP